ASTEGAKHVLPGSIENGGRLVKRQKGPGPQGSLALLASGGDPNQRGARHRKIRPDDAHLRGRRHAPSIARRIEPAQPSRPSRSAPLHLAGRLVLAQPQERWVAELAVPGALGEGELGDELGLEPGGRALGDAVREGR